MSAIVRKFELKTIVLAYDARQYLQKKVQKRKVIPLQARTGPEGSTRLRLPDFKTVAT
jgi:hypothetical protein